MAAATRHDRREAETTLGTLLDDVLDGQARAIAAVGGARADIERAAECAAAAMRGGGRLVYLGAGASGGAAFQDYAEMPGTFGLSPRQIHWTGPDAPGAPYSGDGEDDVSAGRAAVDGLRLGARDAVIAVSASGATPYTLAGARAAKSAGAKLIALVCRSGSPLAEVADVAVLAPTGDEAVSGSTRLAAGTAQKAALGAISTLMAARLGHVYRGRMVNVSATNAKLRERAAGIVADLAGVSAESAKQALDRTRGAVKEAVLFAMGAQEPEKLIALHGGDLGAALAALRA